MIQTILVVGAGVSGLSSGILLLKAGYKVQIWAKDLPPNTTSNIAAAFWYPYLCSPQDKATGWAGLTLKYLKRHALDDPKSGCRLCTVTEIFDEKVADPWWADAVESWRRAGPVDLPEGYIDGYQTEAVLMDTTYYLNWLMDQFKELGGRIEQREIKHMDEALADHRMVVNCSGLGSRELLGDKQLFPVRGQVVKIKPNGFDHVLADDDGPNSLAVIIPRMHDTVLGGTKQVNDWNLEVDPQDTQDILQKARALSPAFESVEVISESVGLRPARSEVRLEIEKMGDKAVVHNYGHGGAGFTLSWGCATDVVRLVDDLRGS
ncbi:MAG TPA: FAD-dependent oxidoreductase [Verrucomicrobiae bacterium]|nr:FAD-dependent oxidoreductase [Verrucomicrobiae bacterium]